MHKSIHSKLVAADAALKSTGIAENEKIKSAYKGAVASFGASIIMSDLVPTIQFYLNESENRETNSLKIVQCIASIAGYNNEGEMKTAMMNASDLQTKRALKRKICDAAIAMKIMMRSYEFVKTENVDTDAIHE